MNIMQLIQLGAFWGVIFGVVFSIAMLILGRINPEMIPNDYPSDIRAKHDSRQHRHFKDVREIYEAGKVVMNFDYDFTLRWQNEELPEKLRCHFFDQGRYEIELWLPGVVANEVADQFRDGHEGFFCSFMSHAFYD